MWHQLSVQTDRRRQIKNNKICIFFLQRKKIGWYLVTDPKNKKHIFHKNLMYNLLHTHRVLQDIIDTKTTFHWKEKFLEIIRNTEFGQEAFHCCVHC